MAHITELRMPDYDRALTRLAAMTDSVKSRAQRSTMTHALKSRAQQSTQSSKASTVVKVAGVVVVIVILAVVIKKLRAQRGDGSHSVKTHSDGSSKVSDTQRAA